MSKKPLTIGTVVYNEEELMPVVKVLSQEESSLTSHEKCIDKDKDNNWAYLLVGYEESKDLRSGEKDDKVILENIKAKYAPIVQNLIQTTDGKMKDGGHTSEGKLVYHETSSLVATTNLNLFLKAVQFLCQANQLENKEEKALQSRMYMKLSNAQGNTLLQKEHDTLHPEEKKKVHAYAFVAMPYTYSKGELVLKSDAVFVAFMPKVQFEAGIFFDGTLNNMYNTNLRVDFENYTQVQVDFLNGIPNPDTDIPTNAADLILKNAPKEEVLEIIQNDLKESINFYKNGVGDDKLKTYVQKSAKGASEDLYDYFEDVQENNGSSVEAFVKEELLPSKGSYENDKSNIATLYDLYNTNIKDSAHQGRFFRKNIYITGAGSYNPYLKEEHKSDAVLGKALGVGKTGILAKVNQACTFIQESIKGLSYVDTLVLDVFGFSRGAAEARHFVNALANELDVKLQKENGEFVLYKEDGSNLYPFLIKEIEGKEDEVSIEKIVFRFVGIFDTVAHHGLSQGNDTEKLKLFLDDKKISNVLHIIAKDEFRENFALTQLKSSARHFEERSFHGSHSDVGGGYRDGGSEKVLLYRKYNLDENSLRKEIRKLESKLITWNTKYQWLEADKAEIHIGSNLSVKDGFYIEESKKRKRRHKNTIVKYSVRVWMIRSSISSEYAKLPLEYMCKKLGKLKLPFKKFSTSQDENLISNGKKQKIMNSNEAIIKSIRAKYLHHSSDLHGVGMDGTDTEDGTEFYGTRVVYKD